MCSIPSPSPPPPQPILVCLQEIRIFYPASIRQILEKLGFGDKDHVTAEQVKENLDGALEPFDNNQRDALEGENDAYEVYERGYGERDDSLDGQHHERDEL